MYIWACVCPDIFVELRGQLLGSTMWALGVELRLLGMAASAFILWTISPACNQSFLLDFKIISMFSSLYIPWEKRVGLSHHVHCRLCSLEFGGEERFWVLFWFSSN